jgi:hypothetical protein
MPIINALFLALVAGLILAIPAIIAELGKPPADVPLFVDVRSFWGKHLTKREAFWFGLLIHFIMVSFFGVLYEHVVIQGVVPPYRLGGLLAYASGFWVVVGAVIFPLVGLGFFGRKEGKFVWLELLVVHHLLALLMWLTVLVFPVLKP